MALPITADIVIIGGGYSFVHGSVSGKRVGELILDGEFKTLDVSMLDLARFN